MKTRAGAGVCATTLLLVTLLRSDSITALAGPGPLVATASMSTQRSGHTATLLTDGSVLVAGGETCLYIMDGGGCDLGGSMSLASAEIYHPDTGTWAVTGSMLTSRYADTATRLPDGRVLIAGGLYEPPSGSTDVPSYLASAELYDPSTGRWTATGSLPAARGFAMATLLGDGTVLVAGGTDGVVDVTAAALTTATIYHPDTGTWSATGSMAQAHESGTMTRLADGKVLVAGGWTTFNGTTLIGASELYDPANGTWSVAGSMVIPRANHSATLLNDGTVLVAGGDPMGGAELFQPTSGSWSATASTFNWHGPSAVLLSDGTVLLADSVAELYDPVGHSWAYEPATLAGSGQSVTRLNDGRVLVAGGCCDPVTGLFLASAELYGAPGTTTDAPLTMTGRSVSSTEGSQFSGAVATFTDADPSGTLAQFTASIDWGDGSTSVGSISGGPSAFTISGSHGYAEEGSRIVAVSIKDSGGAASGVNSQVSVGDASLAVNATNYGLGARVKMATTLALGSLTDADPGAVASDYVVTVAWGDGNASTGSVISGGAGFLIQGTHTYLKKGLYSISVRAGDLGGFTASAISDSIQVSP